MPTWLGELKGVKREWKDETNKCERHERWFDDENTTTLVVRAQGGTTFCFGFLKTLSPLRPISSIIYFILSMKLSASMGEASHAGMYGRGVHTKRGCRLIMYRRAIILTVRCNLIISQKGMGAVPSELGEFFSCREGQHSTVIHRVRYPQIRANTTTLETQWGGFEKIVHSCGEQLLMKRPLKIQFEKPARRCCI